jgi:hypothetical protein
MFSPTNGIAVTKLVITVAPQKLIWPQGKTYPINAVPIIKMKITIPDHHKYFREYRYER